MRKLTGIIMLCIGICNAPTREVIEETQDLLVFRYCLLYSDDKALVEEALVHAIMKQESQKKPFSCRIEKHLKTNQMYLNNIPKKHRDNNLSYCSMGPMQILYGTARWMGFRGPPEKLFDPRQNIRFSIKYLHWLIKKYWRLDKVISAYNMGSPKRRLNKKTGKKEFVNKHYVDNVMKYYKQYKSHQ